MSCEALFLEQLHHLGYRLTPQREMVLLILHEIGHPAAAEEIHALVAKKSSSVELSTVYRTLDLLNSMSLVSVIDKGDKQRFYELVENFAPHLHLACRSCGKIISVELDAIQSFLDSIQARFDFTADLGSITLQGLCEDCKAVALSR